MAAPTVYGPRGEVISGAEIAAVRARAGRMGASLSGSAPQMFPYDAAEFGSPEMSDWLPWLRSPDAEINLYRDRMVARQRDQVRNDPWANGAVDSLLDSTVGSAYRLIATPDYRRLGLYDKAFDAAWAKDYRHVVEALWREYADDVLRFNDVAGQLTVPQQLRLAMRHKIVDGEALTLTYWLPEYVGPGAANYATAFLNVDPDRLSNPFQGPDTKYLRGGVEITDNGRPVAYHVRKAHQYDWYSAVESMEWDRVPRQDSDGFLRVMHDFEVFRAGQHRGVSIFASILKWLKMLAVYYGVELQAATVASVFGTFITSPFDHQLLEQALTSDSGQAGLGFYQDLRSAYHDEKQLMLNRVRIPALAPGEDIKAVSAARPHDQFSPFTHEMHRLAAAALGLTEQQINHDYSTLNYSSARAALVEVEKTFTRRLQEFDANTARPLYACWLHELHERRLVPMPRGARTVPTFREARNPYSRCRWLGVAAGWVDPVAERQGEVLGLDAAFNTLEGVCARQGSDWEEVVDQRAIERARFDELGLQQPQWQGEARSAMAEPAAKASKPPNKPMPA